MIAPWLVYASAMGVATVLIALLLERIARWRSSPTRWVWLAAILIIIALPVVLNFALSAPVRVASTPAPIVPGLVPIHQVHYSRVNIDGAVLALWFLASLGLSARVIGGALALRRRRKSWISAQLSGADVLVAEELGPAVIGWTRLTTVIPRWALTFNDRARSLMLEHEAQHAQSGDPYLRSIALVALILMPWNPALWWAMRRLRLAVEMDCDQRVLARGVDPREYASLLLAVGERMSATPFAWATALGGSRSSLEKRIVAMTRQIGPRHRKLAIAGIGAVIVAVIAIACASPVPDPLVPPAASVATKDPAWSPDKMSTVVADTLFFDCKDSPEARADTACTKGPQMYVNYRRRAPRDTVTLPYNGHFPASVELEDGCEIHSDCNGFVGEGRRNDTLFIYRNDGKLYQIRKDGVGGGEVATTTGVHGAALTIRAPHARELPSLAFENRRDDDLEVVDSVRACTPAQKAAAAKQGARGVAAGEVYYKKC